MRFEIILSALFVSLLNAACALAQNKPGTELRIHKTNSPIRVDGVLDEPIWHKADTATGFYTNFPIDSLPSPYQTLAHFAFDDHFFYASFVCYEDDKPYLVQSMKRDYDYSLNDWVGFCLDPYNDFTNGFYFIVTPFNVQNEGTVSSGGSSNDSFNANWDNKWYSAARRETGRYVVEMAIPFKSFRYNNLVNWNISILRNEQKRNHFSSWVRTPIQYAAASFAYSGKLVWQDPLPTPGTNVSLIPYLTGSGSQDKENNQVAQNTGSAGFDAKVGLTPSLNLDLTVNPDFSNVEVDRQVINLTRFEYQFPERRQFFLENNDLFASPGFSASANSSLYNFTGISQPFFSRRIGLASDSAGVLQKVPISFGARVSGKLGPRWRIGAMTMQTKRVDKLGLPARNYTVAVAQRQIFSRSNIDLFLVNTQSLGLGDFDSTRYYHESIVYKGWNGKDSVNMLHKYNRVVGSDFNLITKNNMWSGKLFYHRSFDDFSSGKAYSFGTQLTYSTRHLLVTNLYYDLGKNFNAEAGFVPSLAIYPGNRGGVVRADVRAYPNSKVIAIMGPGLEYDYTYLPDGTSTDRALLANYAINFRNTASFNIIGKDIYSLLPADFNLLDPKDSYQIFLKGQSFHWRELSVQYGSDYRKLFNYKLNGATGQFYNGKRNEIGGTISYRVQPYGSVSTTFDYNDISLPTAYGSTRFLLVSPRVDFTLTRAIFLTTFVQYNNRYDNVNLNARFQWRFKPASDFFIVYTENYFPEHLVTKNRALVLKLTYWFNL